MDIVYLLYFACPLFSDTCSIDSSVPWYLHAVSRWVSLTSFPFRMAPDFFIYTPEFAALLEGSHFLRGVVGTGRESERTTAVALGLFLLNACHQCLLTMAPSSAAPSSNWQPNAGCTDSWGLCVRLSALALSGIAKVTDSGLYTIICRTAGFTARIFTCRWCAWLALT